MFTNLWLNLSDRCGLTGTGLRRYDEKSSTVLRGGEVQNVRDGADFTERAGEHSTLTHTNTVEEESFGARTGCCGEKATKWRILHNVRKPSEEILRLCSDQWVLDSNVAL